MNNANKYYASPKCGEEFPMNCEADTEQGAADKFFEQNPGVDRCYVYETYPRDIAAFINGETVLTTLIDELEVEWCNDWSSKIGPNDCDELTAALQEAFKPWADRKGLPPVYMCECEPVLYERK